MVISNLIANVVVKMGMVRSLDKTIRTLRMEVAASRTPGEMQKLDDSATNSSSSHARPKVFAVIGINTAFSSRKRRDSVRETWMPQGIIVCDNHY